MTPLPSSANPARRIIVAATAVVATTIICLILLELLVRTFIFDPSLSYIRTPGWSMLVKTNGVIPHVEGDHRIVINSQGFRGGLPPISPALSIAVIGGSTVEDWVLSEEETWTKKLQADLAECAPDVWAANLGKSGTNARHHLIQLPETESYMQHYDYIVVLMGLNDFLYDFRIHHSFETPENWWRDQALMYQGGSEGTLATIAMAKRLYTAYVTPPPSSEPVSNFGAYMQYLWDAYHKVSEDQWVTALPDASAHLETYKDTIRRLKTYADGYGAELVLVTQPYVWSDNMDEAALNQIYAGFIGADITSPETKWYTASALERGLAAYNATLLTECAAQGILCVDAAQSMIGNASFFYDDFHFSEAGADHIAGRVAAAFKTEIPIQCR